MGHRAVVRALVVAGAVLAAMLFAPRARGVVTGDPMPAPVNGFVGAFNGSSCVAVGPFWCITAKHVGGSVDQYVYMQGAQYRVVEIVPHPLYDCELLRVAEELPGYHHLASNVGLDRPCVLGGFGATAGASLASGNGYDWNGPHVETWGENVIEGEGSLLAVRFDSPTSGSAVPHEAIFAVNDSGGGLFVYGPGGDLQLAGIAISVIGWGSSQWNNAAFALNVDLYRNWMMPIVDPGAPVSSAVEAPRAMIGLPGLPPWLNASATGVLLLALRRRRS
jgi:hypothetical protein